MIYMFLSNNPSLGDIKSSNCLVRLAITEQKMLLHIFQVGSTGGFKWPVCTVCRPRSTAGMPLSWIWFPGPNPGVTVKCHRFPPCDPPTCMVCCAVTGIVLPRRVDDGGYRWSLLCDRNCSWSMTLSRYRPSPMHPLALKSVASPCHIRKTLRL